MSVAWISFVSEENDKMSGSGLPLQPGTPAIGEDERSQFWEIIRMLDDGLIQDDEAAKRLMRIYQTSFAGQLRALGETNPEVLGRVMTRLNDEMRNISERFDASAAQPIGQQTKKLDISALRMKSKKSETLLREEKVVGALARDGNSRPFVLSELVEQARIAEPEIMDAAVTANLDRLCKLGVIDRPRKGYYAANDQSNAYLVELNIEIDARGLKQ